MIVTEGRNPQRTAQAMTWCMVQARSMGLVPHQFQIGLFNKRDLIAVCGMPANVGGKISNARTFHNVEMVVVSLTDAIRCCCRVDGQPDAPHTLIVYEEEN